MWNSNETGGGYFNTTNGVESPSKKQGSVRRLQSIVPVAIRQIRDCREDEFKMFGMNTQILSIVGILREYEVQSTKATYTIEDHTGTIKAIWWLENDGDETPNLPPVREGHYLQVFGSLRVQENEKILMVLKMYPVDDANVVTTHLLQVIHVRLEAENLSKGGAVNQSIIKRNNPGAELANSMSYMDDNMQSNETLGLNPIQQKVFNLMKGASDSTAGIHRQTILRSFPQHQQREANQAVEFLINEGHAYSTVDNDHFKITSAM